MEYIPIVKKILKWINLAMIFSAALFTIIGLIIDRYYTEAKIEGTLSKWKYAIKSGNIFIFNGDLSNPSTVHAENLMLKGVFNPGEVVNLDIETDDTVESKKLNAPRGCAEFFLKRLSTNGKCLFDILVYERGEVEERVTVSWGKKGKLTLRSKQADERLRRGIKIGMDLPTRKKWVENNSKVVR
jgi:hypothetical protein